MRSFALVLSQCERSRILSRHKQEKALASPVQRTLKAFQIV